MDKNPSKHSHSPQASLQIAFGTNHCQVELQQTVVLSLEKGGIEQTNMRTPGEERHSSALALNEDRELVRGHMGKEAFAMAKRLMQSSLNTLGKKAIMIFTKHCIQLLVNICLTESQQHLTSSSLNPK